jgi:hypothetical protein
MRNFILALAVLVSGSASAFAADVNALFPVDDNWHPAGISVGVAPDIEPVQYRARPRSADCDFDARAWNVPIFGKCPQPGEPVAPVINPNREAADYENRQLQYYADHGGCDAPGLPYGVYAHCWNWATHNYPLEGGIGSTGGSD